MPMVGNRTREGGRTCRQRQSRSLLQSWQSSPCPPAPAQAASTGGNSAAAGGCTVSGQVVSVTGLPTDQVVNLMVTTAAGTTGWVLGFTPDGTWAVDVP